MSPEEIIGTDVLKAAFHEASHGIVGARFTEWVQICILPSELAIARVQTTDVTEEDSLFSFGQRARARKTRAIAEVGLDHGANRASGCSGPDVIVRWPGFARALAQAVTPSHGA